MQWWLWLVIGAVFGVIVVAAAIGVTLARLTDLRMAVVAADEHRKAADRVRVRGEKLQADLQSQVSRLGKPTRGTIR